MKGLKKRRGEFMKVKIHYDYDPQYPDTRFAYIEDKNILLSPVYFLKVSIAFSVILALISRSFKGNRHK